MFDSIEMAVYHVIHALHSGVEQHGSRPDHSREGRGFLLKIAYSGVEQPGSSPGP